jgi:hypothetical protein
VIVPDNAPIVTFAPADRTALTTGANVIVFSQRNADGSVAAAVLGRRARHAEVDSTMS